MQIIIIIIKMSVFILASCNSNFISFESKESKNQFNKNVFNQIKLKSTKYQDTWYMNQNHTKNSFEDDFDQLKIIVDKKNKKVNYYQFKDNKKVPFSVKCTLCHSNGPRTITPTSRSYENLTLNEKMILYYWNIKIKTYGKLINNQNSLNFEDYYNQPLTINSCTKCHNNDDYLSRGSLKRGNFLAIKYQLENNLMPPWPYTISEKEKFEIKKFLSGFSNNH